VDEMSELTDFMFGTSEQAFLWGSAAYLACRTGEILAEKISAAGRAARRHAGFVEWSGRHA
jgi:hypothetical protein